MGEIDTVMATTPIGLNFSIGHDWLCNLVTQSLPKVCPALDDDPSQKNSHGSFCALNDGLSGRHSFLKNGLAIGKGGKAIHSIGKKISQESGC